MYRALIIGCGNIGALYDIDNDQVLTHAKAYAQHPAFSLTVFDPDKTLQARIAAKYNALTMQEPDEVTMKQFDCVSICSPTTTHAMWLKSAMQANVKVILCEKPVSNQSEELAELEAVYKTGHSAIMVNYIRRFQPAYLNLKNTITQLLQQEPLTNISIRYQRGFINNASHAFDLLQFLFDKPVALQQVHTSHVVNDHSPHDPTLTLTALWGNAGFNAHGLANVQFAHFEIDLYFGLHKIMITDAGKTIITLEAPLKGSFLQPLVQKEIQHGCIANYMEHVIAHAAGLLEGKITKDNFLESVNLNQQMLNYIQN
jgi:predicted dehydrogenase